EIEIVADRLVRGGGGPGSPSRRGRRLELELQGDLASGRVLSRAAATAGAAAFARQGAATPGARSVDHASIVVCYGSPMRLHRSQLAALSRQIVKSLVDAEDIEIADR